MSEVDGVRGASTLAGTVLGRYLLERWLGEGGMGVVYAARHQALGKPAAIKVLHERFDSSEQVRGRFVREGQAASRIRHPNVVDVYDVGTDQGRAYLVMELLEGENLGGLLARERLLSPERIADLLVPVASALAAAHELGVVHRDLKPDNIFLAVERTSITPKVLDFGISKFSGLDDVAAPLTGTGTLLGTPYYMSPEQAQTDKSVDGRSDQYSMGVILYQCAAGRVPIEGALYQLIPRIVQGDYPAPRQLNPAIPAAFEQLIVRAMARDPSERFPSMRALGLELLAFASERVRANHAEELAREGSPAVSLAPATGPHLATGLGTTLGASVHAQESGRKPSAWRRVTRRRAGAVLAVGVALVTLWQLSRSAVGRRPVDTETSSPAPASNASPSTAPARAAHAGEIATVLVPAPALHPRSLKRLSSTPSGASVWIDGKQVGETPLAIDVPAALEVEVRLPGFASQRRWVSPTDPEAMAIALVETRPRLKPAPTKKAAANDRPTLAPR